MSLLPDDWREIPAEMMERLREHTLRTEEARTEHYYHTGVLGQFAGIPVYHNEGRWYVSIKDLHYMRDDPHAWEKAERYEAMHFPRQHGKSKGTHVNRPGSPTRGQVYVDLDTNTTHRFDGVQWTQILKTRWPDLNITEVPDDMTDEEALESDEERAKRICIWCGDLLSTVEALAIHEETCE